MSRDRSPRRPEEVTFLKYSSIVTVAKVVVLGSSGLSFIMVTGTKVCNTVH